MWRVMLIGVMGLALLSGCRTTQWQVIPLHQHETSRSGKAILLNTRTGETWVQDLGSGTDSYYWRKMEQE